MAKPPLIPRRRSGLKVTRPGQAGLLGLKGLKGKKAMRTAGSPPSTKAGLMCTLRRRIVPHE
jgi:hypothetical protein